jgi:hypothetical protein
MGKKGKCRIIFILITLVFLTTFFINNVSAAINCGQTLTQSGTYTLENDLDCAEGKGLIIRGNNIILDCNGHYINGNCPLYSNSYTGLGINITKKQDGRYSGNVVIKNCDVGCFKNAINASGIGISIINNLISETNYGIFLKDVSGELLISSNIIDVETPYHFESVGISVQLADGSSGKLNITNNSVSGAYRGYAQVVSSTPGLHTYITNNIFCGSNPFDLWFYSTQENDISCSSNLFNRSRIYSSGVFPCKNENNYECPCSIDSVFIDPGCELITNGNSKNYTCGSFNKINITMSVSGSFCEGVNGAKIYLRDKEADKSKLYSISYRIPCTFYPTSKLVCSFSANSTFFTSTNLKKLFGVTRGYKDFSWNATRIRTKFVIPLGTGLFFRKVGDINEGNLIKNQAQIKFIEDACFSSNIVWYDISNLHNTIIDYSKCNLESNYNCVTNRSAGKFDTFCLQNSSGKFLVPIQVKKAGGGGFFENLWELLT